MQLDGANASAEEADEGTDSASESGVDLILNHRLVETGGVTFQILKIIVFRIRIQELKKGQKI